MTLSETVGCACMMRPSSSDVVSRAMPTQASASSSVAWGPMMWTPRTSSYFFSATILTKPSVSPRMRALPEAEKGNLPDVRSNYRMSKQDENMALLVTVTNNEIFRRDWEKIHGKINDT